MIRRSLLLGGILAATASCAKDSTAPGPLPACSASSRTVVLAAGGYVSYDPTADSGCVSLAANASANTAEYLVVVHSAGGTPGDSSPYRIRSAAATPNALAFDRFLRRAAHQRVRTAPLLARQFQTTVNATPPAVGSLRSFRVCATTTCSSFKTVTARAQAVGTHVAIYVDTLAPAGGLSPSDISTLEQTFDTHVYAVDTTAFGRETDIDGNGVVIALLTGTVNGMVTKSQCQSNGFVVGFFYTPDLDPATAAQYNDGEIFYAIVPDPNETLSCAHSTAQVSQILPVTFLHEFEHMISYGQHVLINGSNPEDDWLDEALAKYAEELGGRSFLPNQTTFLDYAIEDLLDAYDYLKAPQQHFLLTTSDMDLPDVGAGWLYVRYLVDHFGAGLSSRLVRTGLTGTANVAAQTGVPFEITAERWALANWVSDLPGFTAPGELTYTSWAFRQTYQSLHATDPTDFPTAFPLVPTVTSGGTLDLSGSLHAGSGVYLRVVQPGLGPRVSLHLNYGMAPPPARLVPRVSVIRIR